jgi:hypothetical protein
MGASTQDQTVEAGPLIARLQAGWAAGSPPRLQELLPADRRPVRTDPLFDPVREHPAYKELVPGP